MVSLVLQFVLYSVCFYGALSVTQMHFVHEMTKYKWLFFNYRLKRIKVLLLVYLVS